MSNKSTSTQRATPFEPTIAPLTSGVSEAQDLYNSGGFEITPYQGDWVANTNAVSQAGQDGLVGAATAQQGGLRSVIDAITNVASSAPGEYNFNFDPQRKNVIDNLMPALNGTFAGSGMTGSSLHQQNLAKGLSSGLASAEMGFRDQEMRFNDAAQARAFQAANMLPALQNAELAPYANILSVGDRIQGQEQAEIDALIQQDALSQGAGASALKDYMALLSGIGGQFGSQTATQTTRPGLLSILGGATQTASLFGG